VLKPEELSAFLRSADNVQRSAVEHLRTHPAEASVVAFVRNLHEGVDHVVSKAVHQGARMDCKAGCSHCCNARVEAIAPEIFQIAAEIERRPAAERRETVDRLKAHAAMRSEDTAPWSRRKSCPFLIDHLCSIYQVRPAACRKAHSTDVRECEANAPTIPQNLEMVLDIEALRQGTSAAYRQSGFDASGHELVQAVLLALLDPSARTRWHSGEQVFELALAEPPKPVSDAS
jgi:Fe-S-cluster containining protein